MNSSLSSTLLPSTAGVSASTSESTLLLNLNSAPKTVNEPKESFKKAFEVESKEQAKVQRPDHAERKENELPIVEEKSRDHTQRVNNAHESNENSPASDATDSESKEAKQSDLQSQETDAEAKDDINPHENETDQVVVEESTTPINSDENNNDVLGADESIDTNLLSTVALAEGDTTTHTSESQFQETIDTTVEAIATDLMDESLVAEEQLTSTDTAAVTQASAIPSQVVLDGKSTMANKAENSLHTNSKPQFVSSMNVTADSNKANTLDSLNFETSVSNSVEEGLEVLKVGVEKRGNIVATSTANAQAVAIGLNERAMMLNNEKLARSGKFQLKAELIDGAKTIESAVKTAIAHPANQLSQQLTAPQEARMQMPVVIRFGQPGWAGMVAERSAMMAAQNIKFAELQLDPPELGPLQVKVTVNQEQAQVSFVAANASVRDALDQTLPKLREMLEEQGLDLLDVNVSDQESHESEESEDNHDSNGAGLLASEDDGLNDEAETVRGIAQYGVDSYA